MSKRRGNIKIMSVNNTNDHAQTIRVNYCRAEINGGSSLISRPEERGAKARKLTHKANVRLHKQSPDFWTNNTVGLISASSVTECGTLIISTAVDVLSPLAGREINELPPLISARQ